MPVVGADNNGFVGQMIDLKGAGFTGAAVTNPPSVGGAGLAVALDVLQKKDHPHVIKITPAVWDNTSDANIANLKKNYDPKLDPFYGVAYRSEALYELFDGADPGLQGALRRREIPSPLVGEG